MKAEGRRQKPPRPLPCRIFSLLPSAFCLLPSYVPMKRLLIVEDKESLAHMLRESVKADGLEADVASSGSEAIRWLAEGRRYVAVLTDLRLPGADGIAVLRQAKENDPDCPVIVMTAFGTIENAVEAMKLGAYDFIQKPIDVDHLSLLLRRCREHRELRHENLLLKEEFQKLHRLPAFVGINCAAIPLTLIENELFGHEKGAFTGASARQLGKFELADNGTIFLDEIGELPVGVQAKVLRILQERRFERIGGAATIDVDVRVLCATNRNLVEDVKHGRFREDLFFRINVFPVTIPPLRARREDLDALIDFFLARLARELAKPGLRISEAARALLRAYEWPGNIRELENCIERAAILCDRSTIEARDINVVPSDRAAEEGLRDAVDLSGTLAEAGERAARIIERLKIADALGRTDSRAAAADLLGITPRTLAAKMKEHGIE